ncbi:hypothetical protein BRC81_13195 [Halobacteriales archaeon QS_1_68_20]|nr:MAG: hypothetical protein BRC81_13195 [Halobacteriales archaeon QS_1_68_20]
MRRRNILRAAAVGTLGGIGSMVGAAGSYCYFGSNPAVDPDVYPGDVGIVGSRDHFVCYDGCGRHPDYGKWEYNASDVPCTGNELIVFVSDGVIPEDAADQVQYFRDALDEHAQGDTYPGRSASGPHDLVVYTWDAGGPSPSDERDLATMNGFKLAQFIMDYKASNGGVPVRVVSLGTADHVGANAVRKLYQNGYSVESLDFLASVIHRGYVEKPDPWNRDIPMLDFPYGESKDTYGNAIEGGCFESDVYYRTDQDDGDGVFGSSVQLGAHGYDDTDDVPENIQQHDVTGLQFDTIYGLMTAEWDDDECGATSSFRYGSVDFPYYRDSIEYTHYPGTDKPCHITFEVENGDGIELYATKDGRTPTTSDYDKKVSHYMYNKRLTVYHDGDYDIPALKVLIKRYEPEFSGSRTLSTSVEEYGWGDGDGIRGYDIPN